MHEKFSLRHAVKDFARQLDEMSVTHVAKRWKDQMEDERLDRSAKIEILTQLQRPLLATILERSELLRSRDLDAKQRDDAIAYVERVQIDPKATPLERQLASTVVSHGRRITDLERQLSDENRQHDEELEKIWHRLRGKAPNREKEISASALRILAEIELGAAMEDVEDARDSVFTLYATLEDFANLLVVEGEIRKPPKASQIVRYMSPALQAEGWVVRRGPECSGADGASCLTRWLNISRTASDTQRSHFQGVLEIRLRRA